MTKNQVKMWVVGLLAGGSLLACSPKEIQTGNLNVIPLPQEITETADASPFVIRSSTTICYPEGNAKLEHTAHLLATYIKEVTGTEVKTGTKAAVKISQRKGETDHPDDITVTTPATIASVTIKNCSFDGNVVDYNCGTTPKGEDTNANLTTGHYPMYIESNATDVRIAMPYLVNKGVDAPVFTAKAGENYYKSPDGEI